MDFKKLFRKDDKAVSPVIGVILMVAITVILAAAIGSSVFSKSTAESAPQANLNIKALTFNSVKVEHLGGDAIKLDNAVITMHENNEAADPVTFTDIDTTATPELSAGGLITITGMNTTGDENVNIKIVDKTTNQLICDKNVRMPAAPTTIP